MHGHPELLSVPCDYDSAKSGKGKQQSAKQFVTYGIH